MITVDTSDLTASALEAEALLNPEKKAIKPKNKRGRPTKTPPSSEREVDIEMGMLNQEQKEFIERGFTFASPSSSSVLPPKKGLPPKDDQLKNKLVYINFIEKYHSRWPQDYGNYREIDPNKTSLDQLINRFNEMRLVRNTRFGHVIARQGFSLVGKGLEFLWQTFGYGNPALGPAAHTSLSGLGDILGSDECFKMFQEEVDEFRILYPSLFSQPLWMRFVLKLSAVVQKVSEANREAPSPASPPAKSYDNI